MALGRSAIRNVDGQTTISNTATSFRTTLSDILASITKAARVDDINTEQRFLLSCFTKPLARIIHDCEDTKSLFCYKHVVATVFVVAREAFACPTIARHSVCCSPIFSPSLPGCSSIIGRAVPMAEPLLLKAADRRYGLIACMADCLRDQRQAGKVDHSLKELVAQRVFAIACGYPDANDAARLAADPIHKLLLDRDPIEGTDLASQPTLSRFENAIGARELYRLGEALAASVMQRHAERLGGRARRVTIDLDPTDDPTHGAQQLSFFNGHYDTWFYLPVMGFVSFNDEAEQYLCAAVLRPGNVTAAVGAVGILRRLLLLIRHFLPGVRIRVRLDGGFAHPQLLAFLEAEPGVEYVVAMAKNAVLQRKAF